MACLPALKIQSFLSFQQYLEYATRELAEKKGRDLRVFSGGWDILELDDINGNPVEVFLGLSQSKKVVPAPAVTWKVSDVP